ncbi:MAG: transcriptional regulator, partial [Candidatus Binatia bacterium]
MATATKDGKGGRILHFSGFDLDLDGPELRLEGRVVPLRPKSLALICHLAERPGQLVRKEDLVDAIWGTTAVTDATLARTLFDARQALGDDSRQPRFLETVHRLGFRFLGETRTKTGGPASTSTAECLIGRQAELARLHELRAL